MKPEHEREGSTQQPRAAAQGRSPSGAGYAGGSDQDRSTRAQRQQRLSATIDGSPRMTAQRRRLQHSSDAPLQRQPASGNGLPDKLKAGIEAMSGLDMSDVRVHRNSDKPAQLNALAYAQGSEIHLGPGQEHHLPHEAWHTVQQKQGRVRPTVQAKGAAINDEPALEKEADVMGARASAYAVSAAWQEPAQLKPGVGCAAGLPIQRAVAVAGGSFDTKRFEPYFWNQTTAATKHYGAKIILEFTPKSEMGADGDRVSLVQSVKDDMKITKRKSTPRGFVNEETSASEGNKTAGFGMRTTDAGWAIDQQLYDEGGELVNLDPRYAEQRLTEDAPMKARPGGDLSQLEPTGALKQGHVTSAQKSGGSWNTALLSDEPTVPVRSASISGKQEFEVTALHEGSGGDSYVGSVKWGWEVGGDGRPKIIALTKIADGASGAFKAAAGVWNEMNVPNKRSGATGTRAVVKTLPTGE
jgi:hypothetical protein